MRTRGKVQCCNARRAVSELPPRGMMLGGDRCACRCLRQIEDILPSFELSRQLGLPTPAQNLPPATSPTHDKWPVFHSMIILLMAHSYKTLYGAYGALRYDPGSVAKRGSESSLQCYLVRL